jgi:predicted XRE-type DNA-binding protein
MKKDRFRELTDSLAEVARRVGRGSRRPASAKAGASSARLITRGTVNAFADLVFPDAEERQTKLHLAYALNEIMDAEHLAQVEAAARLGLNQPKVSALRNYKLDGFSVERLMTLLTALDQDVDIVIRKKPRSRAAARISVVAA